ncbi:MAG: N-acetylmuramoyl-L-alanine amidase [Alphaproteobacteria bacterium]|jgi:N-acetylmuramoyl-L-alanine amidase|nr:N-acetylmuramoyl-L-alanine amidase [Alphaproteobacteria bacterium]
MLVLHYTGMDSAAAALAHLTEEGTKVSAHYMVDEAGEIYHLVDEDMRAWHAGEAFWRGHTDINDRSIGIEIVNPGHEFGYRRFPEAQMASLLDLMDEVLARHPIPPRNTVGHSDIAPERKRDPGELFDWRRLAAEGIGLWPAPRGAEIDMMPIMLAAFGYDPGAEGVITAFQRHFRPDRITGEADLETVSLLNGLIELIE